MNSRTKIITAVWQLIAEGGLVAVSMRSVAEAADVSVGRVQHHFGTKDALITQSCRAMIDVADQHYRDYPGGPETKLRHAVGHVIPRTRQSRRGAIVWNAYMSRSLVEPDIAKILSEAKRGQEREVSALLAALGVDNELERARALIALADGLVPRVIIGDLTHQEADRVLTQAVDKLAIHE